MEIRRKGRMVYCPQTRSTDRHPLLSHQSLLATALVCTGLFTGASYAQERVDNPFEGARGYLNPEWRALVNTQAAETGGSIADAMRVAGRYPTAIWLDRIGAIGGDSSRMGLREHLDQAVIQADGQPLAITVVIYDLPNRDCAALASSGELRISEGGFQRYQDEYINEIVAIMGEPQYADLRIVNIIEPDSLPNLVTNRGIADCAEADGPGGYADGVAYAIGALRKLPNTYAYIDIGHSGWLGWDSNFGPAVTVISDAVKKADGGVNTIDGFVSNTSGYTPTYEPYLPDSNLSFNGMPVRSSNFYEWNQYLDETGFVQSIREAFVNAGLPDNIGMLIDTSRNGWGGANRATGVSSSSDLNTYVDESRLDRRPRRGGWCNQIDAGIGERPQANPAQGIDAYVWVKPPGESDGISIDGPADPNDPAKRFDPNCDPAGATNSLSGAPHAGRWFANQFEMLVRNAYPALIDGEIPEPTPPEPTPPEPTPPEPTPPEPTPPEPTPPEPTPPEPTPPEPKPPEPTPPEPTPPEPTPPEPMPPEPTPPEPTPPEPMPPEPTPPEPKPPEPTPPEPTPPVPGASVECEYIVTADWNQGSVGVIRMTNVGSSPVTSGWTVNWSYSEGTRVNHLWNADWQGSGSYSGSALSWNSTIEPGAHVEFGMVTSKATMNAIAEVPQVSGDICN